MTDPIGQPQPQPDDEPAADEGLQDPTLDRQPVEDPGSADEPTE